MNEVSRNEIRSNLGITNDTILIGQIGRISPEKNQLFSVMVAKELTKIFPNVKLCFVGKEVSDSYMPNNAKNDGSDDFKEFIKNIVTDEVIKGDDLSSNLFGLKDVDFFISYSSKDQKVAKKLARVLQKEFKATVFLDCDDWAYCRDIMREIDNRYLNKEKKYDYNTVKLISEHFDSMLSVALFQQISKSKILLLINTENSIPIVKDTVTKTLSPWIYEEIIFAKTLILERQKALRENLHFSDSAPFKMSFTLPLDGIKTMDANSLFRIVSECNKDRKKALNAFLNF